MRNVTITLVVGLALIALVGAVTLTRSPPRVVHVNGPGSAGPLTASAGDLSICQTGEALPAHVSAIRLSMWAFLGWKIDVKVYGPRQLLTEGSRGPDWTGTSVTVPVKPLAHAAPHTALCFSTGPNSEPELILGYPTAPARAAVALKPGLPATQAPVEGRLPGRVSAEYLTSGTGSWWSRILAVARHMGLGRAFAGTWIALLAAALMAAVAVLVTRLTLRELP